MKKFFMLMFCVVMAFALAGCGGSNEKNASQAPECKVLKVATDANFPPFEFYQEQSKVHTGFDIALAKAVAKQMGYEKVEFVNVDFKNILGRLQVQIEQDLSSNYISGIHLIKKSVEQFIRSVVA